MLTCIFTGSRSSPDLAQVSFGNTQAALTWDTDSTYLIRHVNAATSDDVILEISLVAMQLWESEYCTHALQYAASNPAVKAMQNHAGKGLQRW